MTVDAGVAGPIDERQSAAAAAAVVVVATGLRSSKGPEHDRLQPEAPNDAQADDQGQHAQRQQSRSVCRICHTDRAKESLISPCRCKGTLGHVHLSCLERWLNQSCRNYCELCNFRYNALETQRYGWLESLRIWINHPRNRRHIRTDILIFLLLTVFTAGLCSLCLLGTRYFILEGARVGFSETWTRRAIAVLMMIVILGYGTSVYLLLKNQAMPWYRWWRGTVNVRLLLEAPPTEPRREEEERQQQQQQHWGNAGETI